MTDRLFVFALLFMNFRCLSSLSHFSITTARNVPALPLILLVTGSHPIGTEETLDGRLPEESSWCSKLLCYQLTFHWKAPQPTPSTCKALAPTETGTVHHHSAEIMQNGVMRSVVTTLQGAIDHTPPPTFTDLPGVARESGEGEGDSDGHGDGDGDSDVHGDGDGDSDGHGDGDGDSDGHGDGDDDVPTFEEFKHQKMIEQEAAKKTTPEPPTVVLTKSNNYASMDCGAKVVGWSRESRNPGAVLIENKDIYMLSPCSADIWFVIELCDLVAVHTIEVASFELFSSIPKDFTVYSSERYPTSEWRSIGEFRASDVRTVQGFPLIESVYAKYIKFVMTSHFGQDYYCPVSLVRVLGASIMEEFQEVESMKTPPPLRGVDDGTGTTTTTILEEEDQRTNVEESLDGEKDNGTSFLSKAKDAVLSLLDHVNEFIKNGDGEGEGEQSKGIGVQDGNGNGNEDQSGTRQMIDRALDSQGQRDTHRTQDNDDLEPSLSTKGVQPEVVQGVIADQDVSPISPTGSSSPEGDALVLGTKEENIQPASIQPQPITAGSEEPSQPTGPSDGEDTGGVADPSGEVQPDQPILSDSLSVAMETPASMTNQIEVKESSSNDVGRIRSEEAGHKEEGLLGKVDVVVGTSKEPAQLEVIEEMNSGEVREGLKQNSGGVVGEVESNGGGMIKGAELNSGGMIKGAELNGRGVIKGAELNSGRTISEVEHTGERMTYSVPEIDKDHEGLSLTSVDSRGLAKNKLEHTALPGSSLAESTPVADQGTPKGLGDDRPDYNGESNGDGSHHSSSSTTVTDGNGSGGHSGNLSDLNGSLTTGGGAKNQEKSVLIRLSNRVRDLEDNISLFSSYLDQLSTSMKKNRNKTDEINKKLSLLGERLVGLQAESSQHSYLLRQLHKDLVLLTDTVKMLPQLTVHDQSPVLYGVIIVLLLFSCISMLCIITSNTRTRDYQQMNSK